MPEHIVEYRYLIEFETRAEMADFYLECHEFIQPIQDMSDKMDPILEEVKQVAENFRRNQHEHTRSARDYANEPNTPVPAKTVFSQTIEHCQDICSRKDFFIHQESLCRRLHELQKNQPCLAEEGSELGLLLHQCSVYHLLRDTEKLER